MCEVRSIKRKYVFLKILNMWELGNDKKLEKIFLRYVAITKPSNIT